VLGTSVGSGSGGTDSESGYKPTQIDILSFIHQCVQCGKDEEPTISLEMPVPSQGHYGFHSFPVVD
jgi:hypothetical protein